MRDEHGPLFLVEHFFSIQGEGRYSGVPSIFLRFGGCNLRCPGFGSHEAEGRSVPGCDTIRAVYANLYGEGWREAASVEELEAVVAGHLEGLAYRPDIVITGGEPMLYGEHPLFYGMVERLVARGFRITVETNATIAPDIRRFGAYKEVTFAMAVKLSNSGERFGKRVVPEAIERLARGTKDSFFKFTLDRELAQKGGAEEIARISAGYENEIYCMPLGDRESQLRLHAPAVAEFCLRHGYRYSDRLHVRLWNREEKR
ncbi:7-carboxy-7-deazaguanine synthase QueE [Hydrogenimonas sp.]